jgi:hypothetical protein
LQKSKKRAIITTRMMTAKGAISGILDAQRLHDKEGVLATV